MGFLRDLEKVWSYQGLSQRSRSSKDLSLAFSEIKSKKGSIMELFQIPTSSVFLPWPFSASKASMDLPWGFLRDQEQIWTYQGYYRFSQRSKASMDLSLGFLRDQEQERIYHEAFSDINIKYVPTMAFLSK